MEGAWKGLEREGVAYHERSISAGSKSKSRGNEASINSPTSGTRDSILFVNAGGEKTKK
jgi:hypothetical protein